MMEIDILSIGGSMPSNLLDEYNKYIYRLPNFIQTRLIEIPIIASKKRTSDIVNKENSNLKNNIDNKKTIIALSPAGKSISSDDFAKEMHNAMQSNKGLSFLIGGPEGLSDSLLQSSSKKWSFGKLTFPHMLVRVLLAEQIYRGYCILNNHPYAK